MPLSPIEHLVGPRVAVRPVAADDLADLLAVNGDPEVTSFLPYQTWTGPEDGLAWFDRMTALGATGTGQQLVIELKAERKVVGTVLLFRFDEVSNRIEIGYALGRVYWGHGYMREALQRTCSHAFRSIGIRRIEAEVNPGNVASNKLLELLGFVLEGRLRKRWVAKGHAYDTNIYGCLADEWGRPGPSSEPPLPARGVPG